MTTHKFKATIMDPGEGGAFVIIPFDVEQAFGKKRVKIKAMIEGEPYRGTLVRMGSPYHVLIILKEIRQKIGKTFGDEISIELEEDHDERKVELPADFLEALHTVPEAKVFFEKLSYTHQKEYVQWFSEAKRPATRQQRIQQSIEMLMRGQREH
jgi:hypothetical protein